MNFFKEKKYEAYRQFLLMWGIIYLFMILESWGEIYKDPKRVFIAWPIWIAAIAFTIVAHYYWLYDKYAINKKYGKYLLLLAGFLVLMILFDFGASILIDASGILEIKDDPGRVLDDLGRTAFVSVQRILIADMPIAYVYAAVRHYNKIRKEQRKLELENHKNEMLLLRGKIEPGFVYKTIDTLQKTARNEQALQTAAYMHELKELFRYGSEDADKEKIPVSKELDFLERYIRLQQIRIADDKKITIEKSLWWDQMPAGIAPMLLLPFIENAFKYGISYEHPSRVAISINVAKQTLVFNCDNTNHAPDLHTHSMGTGLANTIKRLDLQYKNKYELEQKSENGLYAVSLKLDLS